MRWMMIVGLVVGLGLGTARGEENKTKSKTKSETETMSAGTSVDGGAGDECKEAICVGDEAPGFMLKTSGGIYHRSSKHDGRRLLLVFFRTDCKPCLKAMQAVADFHRAWRGRVDVVAVALLERQDGRARLDDYLDQAGFSFPVLVDEDESVASDYIITDEVITLPALFFIDEQGVITRRLHRITRPLSSYLH